MLHQYLQVNRYLKNLNEPESCNCFPKVLRLVNYFVEQFLAEIDLSYVKLLKVTTPDGMIPIKPFNGTDAFSLNKGNY